MEDWVQRRKRGSCNDLRNNDNYNVQHFFKYQLERDMVVDLTIRRFVPELERILEV